MHIPPRGPRTVTYGPYALATIYTDARAYTTTVCLWLADLLATNVDGIDRDHVNTTLAAAHQLAGKADSIASAYHELDRLGQQLEEATRTGSALLVADVLRRTNSSGVVEKAIQITESRYVRNTVISMAYGVTDERCTKLLAGYAEVGVRGAILWLHRQLAVRPTPYWMVPTVVDMATARHGGDQTVDTAAVYEGVLDTLATEELTPSQQEVAFTLAYDGDIDPRELVRIARRLA